MPALVATLFNADLKAKYDALINAKRPAKVAITAIMRKFTKRSGQRQQTMKEKIALPILIVQVAIRASP